MSPRKPVPTAAKATRHLSVVDELTDVPAPVLGVVLVALEDLHAHPKNPRTDLGDLTELTSSIRAQGIKQNLVVVPNPDEAEGGYRIVIGHRRAAAARLADLTHVPAVVDRDLDDAGQLGLMLMENLQRVDLTPVEEGDGYQGLLDLGFKVPAIATSTGRSQATIKTRLKIAALPTDARTKVHTHQTTIDDALALADFEGPDDLRDQLVTGLGKQGFAHLVASAKDEAARRVRVAELRAGLEADGVKVLEFEQYTFSPPGGENLRNLKWDPSGTGKREWIDPEEHASCPGHVAWITRGGYDGPYVLYGCINPAIYGHVNARATVRANGKPEPDVNRGEIVKKNKAGQLANEVRRHWIKTDLLKRAKWPTEHTTYLARLLPISQQPIFKERDLYAELLGDTVNAGHAAHLDITSPGCATKHLLALAIARMEAGIEKDFWRSGAQAGHQALVTHLATLESWGYELAEIEQAYVDEHNGSGGAS